MLEAASRTSYRFAQRLAIAGLAMLHLKSLWALAKGLLKATRECGREAVAKNSGHLVNVETLGLFQ